MLAGLGDAFALGTYGDGGTQGASILLSNGNIFAAWSQAVSPAQPGPGGDTDAAALVGGIYAPDGTLQGDLFQVNTGAAGRQADTEIIRLANDRIVVAWTDYDAAGDGTARARVFNASGTPRSEVFDLAESRVWHSSAPQLAPTSDGGFLAIWHDGRSGAYAQYFDASGGRTGEELDVPNTGWRGLPFKDLAIHGEDRVVVMAGNWLLFGDGSSFEVRGAHYLDVTGSRLTDTTFNPEMSGGVRGVPGGRYIAYGLNEAGGDRWRIELAIGRSYNAFDTETMSAAEAARADMDLAVLSWGGLVATWTHVTETATGFAAELRARVLADDGTPLSPVLTIDADVAIGAVRADPFVTELADDRLFIGWTDGSGTGAMTGQVFDQELWRLPTEGDDRAVGYETDDVIELLAGHDVYDGLGGDDRVTGGTGADTLRGGEGNDEIFGGPGLDLLIGGPGRDRLYGNLGDDVLEGGHDADTLRGEEGADVLRGGDGPDDLAGGAGDDTLYAGAGHDILRTGPGADLYYGGMGQDTIVDDHGGATGTMVIDLGDGIWSGTVGGTAVTPLTLYDVEGISILSSRADVRFYGDDGANWFGSDAGADRLEGRAGDDTLRSGSGDDLADGGTGFDWLALGSGDDTGLGYGGWDRIDGEAGNDLLMGHRGDDSLNGGDWEDTLYGGDHADSLDGGNGRDLNYGGAGNDMIRDGGRPETGADADTIYGGAGNDSLSGGHGDDDLRGHSGSDRISGNGGNDSLYGGDQGDNLSGGDGDDLVFGGGGRDTVSLGDGADTWWDDPQAAYGDDTVTGGRGADTFHSAGGDDRLKGEGGADTFHFAAGIGAMTILDYDRGIDALVFDAALWGGVLDQARLDALSGLDARGDLVLDFGGGASVTFDGLAGNAGLLADIVLG
ncbi:calcium-binding protein [Mesobacterium pallidum]|uniref:calcium-binding protein n=1 Tax=Mesobacterium pallidum TaxID=2872037 RepID=UPI002342E96D|nr:calcium-binding protein [Mesobacterium pallidum]